jgi:hypothetical protein
MVTKCLSVVLAMLVLLGGTAFVHGAILATSGPSLSAPSAASAPTWTVKKKNKKHKKKNKKKGNTAAAAGIVRPTV